MSQKSSFSKVSELFYAYPQESLAVLEKKAETIRIGIPKEIAPQERRVILSPESVGILVNNGYEVYVESGAGKYSHFSDREYTERGARLCFSHQEVYQKADIVLKLAPLTVEEVNLLKSRQTILSAIHLGTLKPDILKIMMQKGITAIGYELLQDEEGEYPIVRMMGEIAGYTSIMIASEYLSNKYEHGLGVLLGGITGVPRANVVIFGAGTVGEFAARAALGLGANVKIFDESIHRLRRIESLLGNHIFTATTQVHYILDALKRADVAIGAIGRFQRKNRGFLIMEDWVSQMPQGSVIIDVSIDQGGCFETSYVTTHDNPTFVKHGVIHFCVPNIPSRVARTATYALSNVITPLILRIGDAGGLKNFIWQEEWIRSSVYVYQGILTNEIIARKMGMSYKDIDLLVASSHI
ncbi:MAG: alanine dehydrogenase [Bacteroidia bacterium]|nr:alanine dehydrogenase [Bacteroidia bacterium]MDW8301483.1 alanine dehydrogenase [Bacteroidia bacterium]